MLLVDDRPIYNESAVTSGAFNIEDFIYPHGLTPPLRHVRKRRFRKRLNKRTIENVEKAVERLLAEDAAADEVKYEVVDDARDLSDDSAGEDGAGGGGGDDSVGAPTPGGESLGAPTPAADSMMDEDERRDDDDDDEGSIDSDLAAEIEAGLMEGMDEDAKAAARGGSGAATGDEDDDDESGDDLFGDADDDDDEDEDEDDDDDEDGPESSALNEERQRVRLLQGEVRDLEGAVQRKRTEVAKAANVILKRRFEENLRKLQAELDSKKASLQAATSAVERGGETKSKAANGPADASSTAAGKDRRPSGASGSGSAEGEDDPDAYPEPEPEPQGQDSPDVQIGGTSGTERVQEDLISIPLPGSAAGTPEVDQSMDVDLVLEGLRGEE